MEKTKKGFTMPHGFLIIGAILLLATIMTWIIPAGEYDRMIHEATGRSVVVAGSYHAVEANPIGLFKMFQSILSGMVDASSIIFFGLISYGYMVLFIHVGALNAGVGSLLRLLKGKDFLMIPVLVIIFSLMGASWGMFEEAYGFIPVVMGIMLSLGYDALLGVVIVMGSVATGYAAAFINPYTTAIAQSIAELPLFSGMGFRVVCYFLFTGVFMIFCLRYAAKIRKDPTKSYTYGDDFSHLQTSNRDELLNTPMTKQAAASLLVMVGSIALFVWGAITHGWYFNEITAVFIISMFIVGFINGMGPSETCRVVVEIYKDILQALIIIGIARAILIVMQDGHIVDSVVYYLSSGLTTLPKNIAACAMVLIQNLLNFFIPSGSGQAVTSMPIMAPLADTLGINRQIAVVAFQFGDGFSNMFWPTSVAISTAIAGIQMNKWYKFFAPLFGVYLIMQFVMIIVACSINLGPF